MQIEQLPDVDYQRFWDQKMFVSHASEMLEIPPTEQDLQDMEETEKTRFVNNQIERRKRIICGLIKEIKDYEGLQ